MSKPRNKWVDSCHCIYIYIYIFVFLVGALYAFNIIIDCYCVFVGPNVYACLKIFIDIWHMALNMHIMIIKTDRA